MEKYSDYAKMKLNKSGRGYLIFFIFMFGFLIALIRAPKEITPGIVLGLLIIISYMFFAWFNERKIITYENETSMIGKRRIENCYIDVSGAGIRDEEKWLDKKINSIHFASDKEKMGTAKNFFYYNILLNNHDCEYGINQKTNMGCYFRPGSGSGKIMKIDGIDCLTLLPHQNEAISLLTKIFDFVERRHESKIDFAITGKTDHTWKALRDFRKNIIEYFRHNLSMNYKEALEIFLSGEEFEVAGVEIEGSNNNKIFLLTAIRTENADVVLFPSKTISYVFDCLNIE